MFVPGLLREWFCVLNSKSRKHTASLQKERRQSTLFPTISKIYEMILVTDLKNLHHEKDIFPNAVWILRKSGMGWSLVHYFRNSYMLERGSKIFGCFLDIRKAFDTVWIDGLLFKLFTELGIEGKMWLAIKDL